MKELNQVELKINKQPVTITKGSKYEIVLTNLTTKSGVVTAITDLAPKPKRVQIQLHNAETGRYNLVQSNEIENVIPL